MTKQITIIDYGVGNLLSLSFFLKYLGYKVNISSKNLDGDILLLPGVGSMYTGMKNIQKLKLKKKIINKINKNFPIIGICLGMQLLCYKGYEIKPIDGLGIFDCKVKSMRDYNIKLPFVGKKKVNFKFKNELKKLNKYNNQEFYFNHSYAISDLKKNYINGYNVKNKIVASISKNNVYGFQFHPEKSGEEGLSFFKEFIELI